MPDPFRMLQGITIIHRRCSVHSHAKNGIAGNVIISTVQSFQEAFCVVMIRISGGESL